MQCTLGPVDLTKGKSKTLPPRFVTHVHIGTLTDKPFTTIPTATDNLFGNGAIPSNEIGIFFSPTTQPSVQGGELPGVSHLSPTLLPQTQNDIRWR